MSTEKPTDQDYSRDLHADLAIAEAATPGPWRLSTDTYDDWGMVRADDDMPVASTMMYARTTQEAMEAARQQKSSPEEITANGLAIASNRMAAPAAMRRAIEAEEAILEIEAAWDAALCNGDGDRIRAAAAAIEAIARRIRAARNGGKTP